MKKVLKGKVIKGVKSSRNVGGIGNNKVVNFDNFDTQELMDDIEKWEKSQQPKLVRIKKFGKLNFYFLSGILARLFKIVVGIFCGAGLWAVMGALAPELHDKLPNFYIIVDTIIDFLNNICGSIL